VYGAIAGSSPAASKFSTHVETQRITERGKMKKQEERGLPSVALVLGYIAVRENCRADAERILRALGYGTAETKQILSAFAKD